MTSSRPASQAHGKAIHRCSPRRCRCCWLRRAPWVAPNVALDRARSRLLSRRFGIRRAAGAGRSIDHTMWWNSSRSPIPNEHHRASRRASRGRQLTARRSLLGQLPGHQRHRHPHLAAHLADQVGHQRARALAAGRHAQHQEGDARAPPRSAPAAASRRRPSRTCRIGSLPVSAWTLAASACKVCSACWRASSCITRSTPSQCWNSAGSIT